MGLSVNEETTKYMYVSRQVNRDLVGYNEKRKERDFNFERVSSFMYLGVTIKEDNNIIEDL